MVKMEMEQGVMDEESSFSMSKSELLHKREEARHSRGDFTSSGQPPHLCRIASPHWARWVFLHTYSRSF